MLVRLKTRLSLSIAFSSLLSIVLLSVIVNFFLESQFREYAKQRQETKNEELVALVARQYASGTGWNTRVVENIGVSVLEESLILRLTDASGAVVWDAVAYNKGICQAMIEKMSERMIVKYPSFDGGLTHRSYDVAAAGGPKIGTLTIGYYGPFFYTDSELIFIDTLNRVLALVALVTVALSLAAGFLLAGSLSAPLASLTRQAVAIAKGDYRRIAGLRSSTREISELAGAIDHMTATVTGQEKLRRRLATDVAHELRTPLAALQAEIEAMIDGINAPSPERLESCREEIGRLTGLIRDMEILSRYDAETMALEKTPFDLGELLRKTAELHAPLARQAGLTVTVSGGPAPVTADREKIVQVILNLFTNAVKFNRPGGSITMSAEISGGQALLRVKDTGIGIPAADRPFVFERFYRVDASRSRAAGGAGIGLSIVREIVRAHQGSAEVKSVLGKGTEITVSLPLET